MKGFLTEIEDLDEKTDVSLLSPTIGIPGITSDLVIVQKFKLGKCAVFFIRYKSRSVFILFQFPTKGISHKNITNSG